MIKLLPTAWPGARIGVEKDWGNDWKYAIVIAYINHDGTSSRQRSQRTEGSPMPESLKKLVTL